MATYRITLSNGETYDYGTDAARARVALDQARLVRGDSGATLTQVQGVTLAKRPRIDTVRRSARHRVYGTISREGREDLFFRGATAGTVRRWRREGLTVNVWDRAQVAA